MTDTLRKGREVCNIMIVYIDVARRKDKNRKRRESKKIIGALRSGWKERLGR